MDWQQEELLMNLFNTLSHELRSPLASIKGYAATLIRHEEKLDSDERIEFLRTIHDSSARLEHVIDQLFEIAQMESGLIKLQLVEVDIVQFLQDTILIAQQQERDLALKHHIYGYEKEQQKFTFIYKEGSHKKLPIICDVQRLRQVLDILLENAMLYSPDGGKIELGVQLVTVESEEIVTMRQIESEVHGETLQQSEVSHKDTQTGQKMANIWIKDCGMGIPSDHLEKVFEQFYRIDKELTREVNGMGLGLTICKQIVGLHQGKIWVESEVNKGSTFHILLPA